MPAGTGVCVVNTVPGAHRGQRLGERQPVLGDQRADALQAEEPGVPLVHVEHLGQRDGPVTSA